MALVNSRPSGANRWLSSQITPISMGSWGSAEQHKQATTQALQRINHGGCGQMGTGGLPITEGGEAPAFGFVGEPPDQHAQQPGSTG